MCIATGMPFNSEYVGIGQKHLGWFDAGISDSVRARVLLERDEESVAPPLTKELVVSLWERHFPSLP